MYQKNLFNLLAPAFLLFAAPKAALAQGWMETSAPTNWWRCIASSADGSTLVAGQWPGGLFVSTNSGATWSATALTNDSWSSVASSADGCELVAITANNPGSGAVFTSTNSGATWVSNSLPSLYWSSVASSADGKILVAAAPFSESITTPGAIFSSTNAGINWTSNSLIGSSGGSLDPLSVAASADGTKMVAAAYGEQQTSVFRSTNCGLTWTQETNAPIIGGIISPSQYIASSADGTKLALCMLSDIHNNPGLIYVSTDSGDTWHPTSAPSNAWQFVTMSANGNTILAVSAYFQAGPIYLSTDCGSTWTTNGPTFGWGAIATSADGGKLATAAFADANLSFNSGPIYLSQFVEPPHLAIGPANGGLKLSWLVPSTNFVLQRSADLAGWANTTNCPHLNPDTLQDEVMIPSTNAAGFYRLKTSL